MIKISIIVPVYNVARYVERCLDSIVHQTITDIEIIVVNDGSTDGSDKICERFARRYPVIKYISQRNQGLSGARNTGIKRAKGEYIGFVDSDDYVAKDMFEFLYNNAKKHGALISVCGYEIVHENGSRATCIDKNVKKFFNRDEALDCYLLPSYYSAFAWNKLYKRELFDDIRFPTGKIYEDIPIVYKLINNANGLYYDSSVKYYYLERDDSLSRISSDPHVATLVKHVDSYVTDCEKIIKHPKMLFLGHIRYYQIAYNKLLRVDQKDNTLLLKIRKLARRHFTIIMFSNKIDFKIKLQLLLLLINPHLYNYIYLRSKG